jgi:hypothetical protein
LGAALRSLDAALLRGDAQFILFDPQHYLVPNLDAQRFPKGCGDHNAAIFVDSGSRFFHGTLLLK